MVTATELRVGRKNTTALIKAHPITSRIQRPVFNKTADGGTEISGFEALKEQTFTVVPLAGIVWDRSDTTSDEGRLGDVTEQIVGEYTMDVQKHDRISWNQDGLEGYLLVTHVSRNRHFRTAAFTRFIEDG